jgi:hypothetical protein
MHVTDFDPHRDTPVEILHAVLLGYVKYFWRDAINRLNDAQKDLLKTRLSCLDVSGLHPTYPLCLATPSSNTQAR